jgi:hypothetical protein
LRDIIRWHNRLFIIQEQQFQRMKTVLARLCVECAARVVFLVDRDGQTIAFHGDIGDMDTTSFSSLAAGNVAATSSMANLIGEDAFPAVVHEGEREAFLSASLAEAFSLSYSTNGPQLAWSRSAQNAASYEVAAILDEAVRESAYTMKNNSTFSEITDEDIDSLFS